MTPLAALTFWPLLAIVVTPALVLAVPVVIHHIACEARNQRSHRRAIELHRSRIQAHEARAHARHAGDEHYATRCRAERDDARRLAVQLLHRNDQLQAELVQTRGELDTARAWVSQQNRANLRRLARAVEADQTMRLPAVRVPAPTRELPAINTGRPVLATA